MNIEDQDELWLQIVTAMDSGDDHRVILLSKQLSEAGNCRGADMLGYIFNKKGRQRSIVSGDIDRESYITAAYWYNRSLSQGGGYESHYGLATYCFYGLGDGYDFKLAYEHLKYCVEYVFLYQSQRAALIKNIAETKIMMAELLFLGLGSTKDIIAAEKLFSEAAQVGYPAAVLGLARIEMLEKNYLRTIMLFFRGLRMAIKLVVENKYHPLLTGVGGKWGSFRRDRLRVNNDKNDRAQLILINEKNNHKK